MACGMRRGALRYRDWVGRSKALFRITRARWWRKSMGTELKRRLAGTTAQFLSCLFRFVFILLSVLFLWVFSVGSGTRRPREPPGHGPRSKRPLEARRQLIKPERKQTLLLVPCPLRFKEYKSSLSVWRIWVRSCFSAPVLARSTATSPDQKSKSCEDFALRHIQSLKSGENNSLHRNPEKLDMSGGKNNARLLGAGCFQLER